MTNKLIRLSKSCISPKEIKAVNDVLHEEYLGMGSYVKQFEQSLMNYFETNVTCVNTGTSAVQLGLEAIGSSVGKEVLVPSITYLATYQAISATGAKPISCDVNPSTGLLCLKDCEKKLSKKTVALVPVFYGGATHGFDEYLHFSKKYNIKCVFDAAHAFGSKHNGKLIGSEEGIYCFSFDGIKNITCGEGGCVTSNDEEIIHKVNTARQLGISNEHLAKYSGNRLWVFDVNSQGWRYHMSNINAAIGLTQLNRFNDLKKVRQKIAKLYDQKFKDEEKIVIFDNNYDEIVPHIYVIKIPKLNNRDILREDLLKNGIETGIHYFPNHLLSLYKNKNDNLPGTEEIFRELLTLPLHPDLTGEDIKKVSKTLISLLNDKKYF